MNKNKSQSGFAHLAIVIVLIVVVLLSAVGYVYWNTYLKAGSSGSSSGKSDNNGITSVSDVKTANDAFNFAKNKSGYTNPLVAKYRLAESASKKAWVISVINSDEYKKDTDSSFNAFTSKDISFSNKGKLNINSTHELVTTANTEKYYGYKGKNNIDDIISAAKSELTKLGYDMGDKYLFEFNDSHNDTEGDSWTLTYALSSQEGAEVNVILACSVTLNDSDLSVHRSGTATLFGSFFD